VNADLGRYVLKLLAALLALTAAGLDHPTTVFAIASA